MYITFFFCFPHHFYFPAQLLGDFPLSDFLDKPKSQVSSLLPPGTWARPVDQLACKLVHILVASMYHEKYRETNHQIYLELTAVKPVNIYRGTQYSLGKQ